MAVPPNQLNKLEILVDDLEHIIPSGFPPLNSVGEGGYEGVVSLVRHEVTDGHRRPAWWLSLTSDQIRADSEQPKRMVDHIRRLGKDAKFAWNMRSDTDGRPVPPRFEHLLSVATGWELQVELQWEGEEEPPRGVWQMDARFLIFDSVSDATYFCSTVDI